MSIVCVCVCVCVYESVKYNLTILPLSRYAPLRVLATPPFKNSGSAPDDLCIFNERTWEDMFNVV